MKDGNTTSGWQAKPVLSTFSEVLDPRLHKHQVLPLKLQTSRSIAIFQGVIKKMVGERQHPTRWPTLRLQLNSGKLSN